MSKCHDSTPSYITNSNCYDTNSKIITQIKMFNLELLKIKLKMVKIFKNYGCSVFILGVHNSQQNSFCPIRRFA